MYSNKLFYIPSENSTNSAQQGELYFEKDCCQYKINPNKLSDESKDLVLKILEQDESCAPYNYIPYSVP
jgi:hypothetical protein